MGRYINAETVGRCDEDRMVHKFWFAVQHSDVSDYLEAYAVKGEPEEWEFAQLTTDHEAGIKATIAKLKRTLQRRFGWTYRHVIAAEDNWEWSDPAVARQHHAMLELASRIDLGEHLLQTIQQMHRSGLTEQGLLIEVL